MKFLIVSGGDTQDSFVTELIKTGGFDVLMAADSGLDCFHRIHTKPDVIVGDFDSAESEALAYFRQFEQIDLCALNPEKEDTDTEFAIREAIRRDADDITIVGATGTRIDHVLGNICLLGIGLEEKVSMCILDPHNRIRMIDSPLILKKEEQYGRYVSLLPYSNQVRGVTLTGFKYPLSDYTMGGFNSLGISNEIQEAEAVISFTEGKLLVIESKD